MPSKFVWFFSFPSFPPFSRSFFQTTLPVQPAPHLPAQSRPLPTLTLQEQATVHIKNPPPDPGNKQIRELRRIPTDKIIQDDRAPIRLRRS